MPVQQKGNGKIAVVASGGGMSCGYAAGAMVALAREYGFKEPDFLIAGSGSTGTFAYYAAKQYDAITRVWTEALAARKFINRLRLWKIIDVDYLIDVIMKQDNPLVLRKVKTSPSELLIAATNADTGGIVYFSDKEREDEEEIFELLRASKAMPIAFGKLIAVDGGRYCDSELSADLRAHIREAVRRGAERIIAINNSVPRLEASLAMGAWLRLRPAASRALRSSQGGPHRAACACKRDSGVHASAHQKEHVGNLRNGVPRHGGAQRDPGFVRH
ncbi:MAG: hypothetical protein HYT31_03395 [Parcubacteria group bacterium]|nr:hypothetical protein [Parcubacteria group bacterium]